MSATIYSSPKEIKTPEFDFVNFNNEKHEAKEAKYVEDIKQYLRERGYNGKNMGEIIDFPAADSQASYMVVSMKPLALMHLELGDAWTSQFAHLMTAKEVQIRIDADKKWKAFIEKNRQKGK